MSQTTVLAESYRYCDEIARTQARNFYYGFRLLPRQRRDALSAIYAFFRACDDYSDEAGTVDEKRAALDRWRAMLDEVVADPSRAEALGPIWPAFGDAIRRYAVPPRYFHELLDGTLTDLVKTTYDTFDELYQYCYRVASTVGLVCVHVFGFDGAEDSLQMAEWCGIAFQLTNILRDVEEDARLGRVYLPAEDLAKFGLTPNDLVSPPADDRFRNLMAFEAARAHDYYARSAPLRERVDVASRAGFSALVLIYYALLCKLEREQFRVHGRRVKLSTVRKLMLLAKALMGGSADLTGGAPA